MDTSLQCVTYLSTGATLPYLCMTHIVIQ